MLSTALKAYIMESLETCVVAQHCGSLTLGVEHEFFLLGSDGLPATHEQGQAFLTAVSHFKNWYIRERSDSCLGLMIERVSKDLSERRYIAVKYDHHPHLFEVAFTYYNNVAELHASVTEVLAILENAATKARLTILNAPSLHLEADHLRVISPLPTFAALRYYRSKLFEQRGEAAPLLLSNYAAIIAATQTHIGGTGWWQPHRNQLVSNLYAIEPDLLAITTTQNELVTRWRGYEAVFRGFPLIGFPHLDQWNLNSWANALLSSPLAGGPDDEWAGKSIAQLGKNPFSTWQRFMVSVRDLQIIRPKLFGTLEFRADPAQVDANKIAAVAALRLGLCSYLLESPLPQGSNYIAANNRWWQTIKNSSYFYPELNIYELSKKGLEYRGLNEERFLAPLERLPNALPGAAS